MAQVTGSYCVSLWLWRIEMQFSSSYPVGIETAANEAGIALPRVLHPTAKVALTLPTRISQHEKAPTPTQLSAAT